MLGAALSITWHNLAWWLGVHAIVARLLPRLKAREKLLATVIFGYAALMVCLEALGAAGYLRPGWMTLAAGGVAFAGLLVSLGAFFRPAARPAAPAAEVLPASQRSRLDLILAAAALTLVGAAALVRITSGLVLPVEAISDAPIYHLPFAIGWLERGRIDYIPTPFGELAAPYFPANGDLWLLWLAAATGSEWPAKAGQAPFFFLAGFGVYALARQVGCLRTTSALLASLWMSLLPALHLADHADVDLIFTTFTVYAAYFSLQGSPGPRRPGVDWLSLVLCGLAGGIAIGTKSIGLPLLPIVFLVALRSCSGRRTFLLGGLVLAAAAALPSCFWFLRNAIATGNPLYPLQVSVLGVTIVPGWYERPAMLESGYHIPIGDWRFLLDRWTSVFDLRLICLWPIALIAGLFSPRTALLSLTALCQAAVYWFVIPYNSQERFLLSALAIGIASLGILANRRLGWRLLLFLILAWHLLTPGWSVHFKAVSGAGTLLNQQGATPLNLAELRLLGDPRWWSLRTEFYPVRGEFGLRMRPAWELLEAATGARSARVAYAGTNLPYYLFGRGLRHRVRYINVNGDATAPLHLLDRDRAREGRRSISLDPFPTWYRENPSYEVWRRNLDVEQIEFLFVARENLHGRRVRLPGPAPFPIEATWADEHPDLFEYLGPEPRPGETEPWARVYRIKGRQGAGK